MPAASVATETGFVDQSHFGHHFINIIGVTPGQYARACAAEPGVSWSALEEDFAGDVLDAPARFGAHQLVSVDRR
jgi:hypothetical protein